jgi:hypothetical protein
MIGLKDGEAIDEYEPVDWSGSEKFPLNKKYKHELEYNIGDDFAGHKNVYLQLRKDIAEDGGRVWEGYTWVTKDWEFEVYGDFDIPKRFFTMLSKWKKIKEKK